MLRERDSLFQLGRTLFSEIVSKLAFTPMELQLWWILTARSQLG
jgi:hypothetical protein